MIVRNVWNRLISVAGVSIPPNRSVDIPVDTFDEWLRRSTTNRELAGKAVRVEGESASDKNIDARMERADRAGLLEDLVREMDPNDEENWTKNGIPALGTLRKLSGLTDVTAQERDVAWEAVLKERADASSKRK